jgi:membrane-associated phospholipid phosphatase
VFSTLGEHAALWLAVGVVGSLVDAPRRREWLRAAAVVGATYGLNTAIKFVVRRQRPQLEGLPPLVSTPTKLSFPSAHSSTSLCAAGQYTRLGAPAAPLYATAVAMAVSRLYLGVHYPSDIVAGAALGAGMGRA